jgi:hypothetical protein
MPWRISITTRSRRSPDALGAADAGKASASVAARVVARRAIVIIFSQAGLMRCYVIYFPLSNQIEYYLRFEARGHMVLARPE